MEIFEFNKNFVEQSLQTLFHSTLNKILESPKKDKNNEKEDFTSLLIILVSKLAKNFWFPQNFEVIEKDLKKHLVE